SGAGAPAAASNWWRWRPGASRARFAAPATRTPHRSSCCSSPAMRPPDGRCWPRRLQGASVARSAYCRWFPGPGVRPSTCCARRGWSRATNSCSSVAASPSRYARRYAAGEASRSPRAASRTRATNQDATHRQSRGQAVTADERDLSNGTADEHRPILEEAEPDEAREGHEDPEGTEGTGDQEGDRAEIELLIDMMPARVAAP